MRSNRFLLVVGVGGLACAALVGGTGPAAADPIAGYRKWRLITKQPVDMARSVALMCASVPVLNSNNPHVPKKFLVYMNDLALRGWKRKGGYPEGSLIVKEKFDAKLNPKIGNLPKPELLTVMVKLKRGSRPSTGDWEFYVADAEGRKAKGPTKHCISCHEKVAGGVFGRYRFTPFSL